MSTLIFSKPQDRHIEPVAQILHARGCDVLWMDMADFPLNAMLTATLSPSGCAGTLAYQERVLDLAQVKSVWWRRPKSPTIPPAYTAAEGEFWVRENERGVTSAFLPAPGATFPFWVSSPDRIHYAARKPRQLVAAQALGLTVPKTILTNNPAQARAFYHECDGQIIAKAICRGVLDPDGEYLPGQARFIYTSAILHEHLAQMDQVRVMLHCFQQRIHKAMDLRVVVIGKQVFAIEIHAPTADAPVALDWRRDYSVLTYAVHQLPREIEIKLVQLVRGFGLQFSSMDVILSQEGEYVFIESNANGQFLWMSSATGLPLAEAMANLLMEPEVFCL